MKSITELEKNNRFANDSVYEKHSLKSLLRKT